MGDLLNAAQERHLRSVLRLFEEDLASAKAWTEGQQEEGLLYSRKLNLDREMRGTLQAYVEQAQLELKELVIKYNLSQVEEDPARLMSGHMNEDWANLVDCQSKKLKGYGPVKSEVAGSLDASVTRLSSLALHLASLFQKVSDATRAKGGSGPEKQ